MNEVVARIRKLREELELDRDSALKYGRRNYFAAYGLSVVIVISSASAGILGLGFDLDNKLVAAVALIPAIAVTVAHQFKWQDKANLHYRRYDAAKALLRRIDYELPENPTFADVAKLSRGYSVAEAEMTRHWEEKMQAVADEAAEKEPGGADEGAAEGRG